MFDHTEDVWADESARRPSLREWIARLSSAQQLGYGCLVIIIAGALTLYCGGTVSLMVRSSLLQRTVTPTLAPTFTQVPSPTFAPPTFIVLPTGKPPATPTQAPIPTREPTATPTVSVDATSAALTATIMPPTTGTPHGTPSPLPSGTRASATPTRRLTGTITSRP